MSIHVMNHVWRHSAQKGSTLLLLLAIADHAHDDGTGAYPAVQTLADKVRMTKRNTQRLLHELAETGELIIQLNAGPHSANLYSLAMGVKTLHPASQGQVDGAGGSDGVTSDAQEGDDVVIQTVREPSREPSLDVTLPLWWITLSKDPHWGGEIDLDYIRDIESFFGHLDLGKEARKCFLYLKDTPPKRTTKTPKSRRTWLNWVERAAKDQEAMASPASHGEVVVSRAGPLDLTNLIEREEAEACWGRATGILQGQLPRPSYSTWIADLEPLGFLDGRLVLKAPSSFVAEYIMKRQIGIIEGAAGCGVVLHLEGGG